MKKRRRKPLLQPGRDVEVSRETLARAVTVDTRRVLTIGPEHEVWTGGPLEKERLPYSIVRVLPPHDATAEAIEVVKQKLIELHVMKVAVKPRASAPEALSTSKTEHSEDAYKTPRAVIDELVKRARVDDRDALQRVVDSCLAEAEDRKPIDREHASIDVGHIVGIRLLNWACFRGEFELELGPTTYSITASQTDNDERSNWLGKSSFLRAVKFALTGDHYADEANGWITRGESEGGVDIEFSNDVFISRFRKRGSSTEVEVVHCGETMTGPAAQRFIDEAIIDKNNLEKTGYLAQKKTDQFVKLKPAAFSDAVNTWLGIDWVAEASDLCVDQLNELTKERAAYEQQLMGSTNDRIEELEGELLQVEEDLKAQVKLKEKYDQSKSKADDYKRRKANSEKAAMIRDRIKELEQLTFDQEGYDKALELKADKNTKKLKAEELVCELDVLVNEGFNGVCPVAGIECPAREQINKMSEKNAEVLEQATTALEAAVAEWGKSDEAVRNWGHLRRIHEQRKGMTTGLREQLDELQADVEYVQSHKPPKTPDDPTEEYGKALSRKHELGAELKMLRRQETESVEARAEIAKLNPKVAVHQVACSILGRSGAQRTIAEGALKAIERGTNDALLKLDVDLRVEVLWDKEGKQLATACDDCGAPFPASRRVKQCERCGAKRGPKLQQKPRLELSNRSGGADDGVGLVFQLSASNWNARRNGLGWRIFLIDEPFGALDRHNTRAIGGRLDWLLREHFGAEQAFVVAHHAEVLESTPGRIHITSDGSDSRIEVLSA